MLCKKRHHVPNGRYIRGSFGDVPYNARCNCCCHNVADAAPELLAACKAALERLEHGDPPKGGRTEEVCNGLRAAIALAEKGGAPC